MVIIGEFMDNMYYKFISKNDIKNLSNWSEKVYNSIVVLHDFCLNRKEVEEMYNIVPIIEYMKKDADLLNAFFININDG